MFVMVLVEGRKLRHHLSTKSGSKLSHPVCATCFFCSDSRATFGCHGCAIVVVARIGKKFFIETVSQHWASGASYRTFTFDIFEEGQITQAIAGVDLHLRLAISCSPLTLCKGNFCETVACAKHQYYTNPNIMKGARVQRNKLKQRQNYAGCLSLVVPVGNTFGL